MKSRPRKPDPAIAKRALQEAADRRAEKDKAELEAPKEKELSGPEGPGSYPIRGTGKTRALFLTFRLLIYRR